MIAKALMGSASPIELLRYVFRREKTPSLVSSNMCGRSPPRLSAEFADVMALRPDIRKPLAHFVLSEPPGVRLPDEAWDQRVRIFLQKLGLDSDRHLFLAVRHSDSGTDHVHCLVLRVGIDSAVWFGRWSGRQAVKAANEITLFFGEQPVVSRAVKALSRAERQMVSRTAVQAPRRVIQDALAVVLTDKPTLHEFTSRLQNLGVRALANVANTGRINGVSFEYAGVPFKGSQLGRSYRWAELSAKLDLAPRQDRLGSDVSLEPRLAARTAQVPTAAPPPQGLSVPAQASNDSPALKSRPPPRIPLPWENGRKNTEGELPPHLRGLGLHGLDDMPRLWKLPPAMTPWELTKTNQYNRLCRSAPQILAPQERSKTQIEAGMGQPDPVISQTEKVEPSVALTGLAPPPGELIDHYDGRWVVRTKSEVLFSDHLVNDVALRKGFEAAANAYGSHLQLRNIDGAMRDRAVNVIARTRSLRMVTFDRAEDQEKLASARRSFEQAQRRDLAEKQEREAAALADRQDAERRRQRERHLKFIEGTRETRLKRRSAERDEAAAREAERVEQARLAQERFDRAQPLRELKARIAELADQIGAERTALELSRDALQKASENAARSVQIANEDPDLRELLSRRRTTHSYPSSPDDARMAVERDLRASPAELRERLGYKKEYDGLVVAYEPYRVKHQKIIEASSHQNHRGRFVATTQSMLWKASKGPEIVKALQEFEARFETSRHEFKWRAMGDRETLDQFDKAVAASGVEIAAKALKDFEAQLSDAMRAASQKDAQRKEEIQVLRSKLSEMERFSERVEARIAAGERPYVAQGFELLNPLIERPDRVRADLEEREDEIRRREGQERKAREEAAKAAQIAKWAALRSEAQGLARAYNASSATGSADADLRAGLTKWMAAMLEKGRDPVVPSIKLPHHEALILLARAAGAGESFKPGPDHDETPFEIPLGEAFGSYSEVYWALHSIDDDPKRLVRSCGNGAAKSLYLHGPVPERLPERLPVAVSNPEPEVKPTVIQHEPEVVHPDGHEPLGSTPGQVRRGDGTIIQDASTKAAKPTPLSTLDSNSSPPEPTTQGKAKSRGR